MPRTFAKDYRSVYYDDAGRPRHGTIYLLHFDAPVRRPGGKYLGRHYLGWTSSFASRVADHRIGRGSRMSWYAQQDGIGFSVAYTQDGTVEDERRIRKEHGGAGGYADLCPFCSSPTDRTCPSMAGSAKR